MTSIFLPSSASTQIPYAVKFNMADKVHRLSLATSLASLAAILFIYLRSRSERATIVHLLP